MVHRNAKIVCTLGPASSDRRTVEALADAGMAVARLNASHGSTADRRDLLDTVRSVAASTGDPVATLLDLPGPEIRTAAPTDPVEIGTGSTVTFSAGETVEAGAVGLSTSIEAASPGDRILLDDGRIVTVVEAIEGTDVRARVEVGGELEGRTGVNVPGVDLGLPMVQADDERELDLAAEAEVDFVAASFVRDAADVLEINAELEERGVDVPVIAKIERADAVSNLASIVEAADGVMVARGDLGVECPLEDVPMIQKRIVRTCHRDGTPVIIATEMLDSMVHHRRPTRAEASDVANAVLDGADAVMLSGETAIGDHPVSVVETMDRIVREVEDSEEYDELREQRVPAADETRTGGLARSARYLARDLGASAVVVASESGYTARKAAKYRPTIPIVATTPDERVRRRLALTWGTIPRHAPLSGEDPAAVVEGAVDAALSAGVVESGDTVVVVSGMMTDLERDTANVLKVHVAAETIATGRSIVAGTATGPLVRVVDGDLSELPPGAVLAVSTDFDGEFEGDLDHIAGIVDAHAGMTGYAAIVAREIGVPAICGAGVSEDVTDGTVVTLDAERGVLYEGEVGGRTHE